MLRKIKLTFIVLLCGYNAFSQVELFRKQSNEIQMQLLNATDGNIAALSWHWSGIPGFALLQPVASTEGGWSFVQTDGHTLLTGRSHAGIFNAIFNLGGKSSEITLSEQKAHLLSGWSVRKAGNSFRHPNAQGSGAIIELNYMFPSEAEHPLVPLIGEFYGLDNRLGAPEVMMQSDVLSFVERYKQMSTASDGNTLGLNWMKSATGFPVFVGERLLCFGKTSLVSTGPQAVRKHFEFAVFDTQTPKRLSLNDIFRPESVATISDLLVNALRALYNLEPGSDIRHAGFYSENVMPNENIILGSGSIGFAYNVYELAPPSKGQPVLMLSIQAVESLLQPSFKALLLPNNKP